MTNEIQQDATIDVDTAELQQLLTGGEQVSMRDVLDELIANVTELDSPVRNVYASEGGEIRCIVLHDGIIKPTEIDKEHGTSTQWYESAMDDSIVWVAMLNGERFLLSQDKYGIHDIDFQELSDMFSEKVAYARSFLGSFGSNNNVLLDEAKVKDYEEVSQYVTSLFGKEDSHLAGHIIALLLNNPYWKDQQVAWENAESLDLSGDYVHNIEWGIEGVSVAGETVRFTNQVAVIWIKPLIKDSETGAEEFAPASLAQVVIRRADTNSVPIASEDATVNVKVKERIHDNVIAYALFKEDYLLDTIRDIQLYKTAEFTNPVTSF